ncbi:MAG: hypothetical protein Kapaf2KO_07920 [Candidatus Kapaibacteriales bacterium]
MKTLAVFTRELGERIQSFGEYLSTSIFSAYLESIGYKNTLNDSTNYLGFDRDTREFKQLENISLGNSINIFQGYVCKTILLTGEYYKGNLGRGGSDYSACIFAKFLQAKKVYIYTDVNGVYNTDPRILEDAKLLSEISTRTMSLMAKYGAKVLHPDSLTPATRSSIPVYIKNTFNPENEGTLISRQSEPTVPTYTILKSCYKYSIYFEIDEGKEARDMIYKTISGFGDSIINMNMYSNSISFYSKVVNISINQNLNIEKKETSLFLLSNLKKDDAMDIGSISIDFMVLTKELGLTLVSVPEPGSIVIEIATENINNISDIISRIDDFLGNHNV